MKQPTFLIFGVAFFVFSCQIQTIDHVALLKESSVELKNESFIIIPQRGCSSCVKKAYDFVFDHYNNKSCKFIFTNYSSRKAVRIRLKVFGLKEISKVEFLELEIANKYKVSLLYPTLIELLPDGTSKFTIMNAEDSSDWKELIAKL